jgi:stage V sporulation protein AC
MYIIFKGGTFYMVHMTNKEYREYVKQLSPNSPAAGNLVKAFIIGGLICTVGQVFLSIFKSFGLDKDMSAAAASITLVFLGAFFTGIGLYDRLAKFAGAGTLVPITGFANSIASPALEFKAEGFVAGTSAKMFIIAGPVLVFGIAASVIYGIIYFLLTARFK